MESFGASVNLEWEMRTKYSVVKKLAGIEKKKKNTEGIDRDGSSVSMYT
jgi:hypothetical protein